MSDTHLMIVTPHEASLILTGQKLVEARLGNDGRAPYNRVQPGDTVFIKPTNQRTIGKAIVHRVDQYEGLNTADIDRLQRIYNDRTLGDSAFWDTKQNAKYATFITLDKVRMIHDESTVPAELLMPNHDDWRVLYDQQQRARAA